MEYKMMQKILGELKENRRVALATITKVEGSTPRKEGSMMAILEDGSIYGTIGGGKVELVVTNAAIKCIEKNESRSYHFQLNDEEGSLHMQCGGEADVFIKVFAPQHKLLLVGGGHISLSLFELGKSLGFYTVIFEDREEFANHERFQGADEIQLGDIEVNLKNYSIDENCYVVIVTRGHKSDEVALKTVIFKNAGYIGMIGSKNKTAYVMDNFKREGTPQELIDKIYAPIGIDLGGETPEEIALSILSEIVLIKNNGGLLHLRDKK